MSGVDVIIPCYQYGHFLQECVESVLSQEGPPVRVLVMDDASRDGTRDIGRALAEGDFRVRYFRHRHNRGHIRTFNEGLEWATAKYTMLLSADDRLLPGALARAVQLMEEHPEVGFTFGSALYLYPDGSTKRVVPVSLTGREGTAHILSGPEFIELSAVSNPVATPTVLVRTELQKRLGGYRHELPHAGDMEMWLRFAAQAPVGFISELQGVYRRHKTNMSSGYLAESLLPDVRQRRAALDCFFATNGGNLQDVAAWRIRLYWALGIDAVALASGALNRGDIGVSRKLADLALEICPRIRASWAWRKLIAKRFLNQRARKLLDAALCLSEWRRRNVSLHPAP